MKSSKIIRLKDRIRIRTTGEIMTVIKIYDKNDVCFYKMDNGNEYTEKELLDNLGIK